MALKITFRQMRLCLYTVLSLVTLWLLMGHIVLVKVSGNVKVDYYFLAPMHTGRAMDSFHIHSEIPGDSVDYHYRWHNPFHLELRITEKEYARGVEYYYSFNKAKAMIPPFTVSKKGHIVTRVAPELLFISPTKNAPSKGPIVLQFNTPILKESIVQKVHCEVPGTFTPDKNNPTRWLFSPHQQLEHQKTYHITIEPGLKGRHGLVNNSKTKVAFTTAPPFKVTETYPQNHAASVWLSRTIKITANQPIKTYQIQGNIQGQAEVKDNVLFLYPKRILKPNSAYRLTLSLTSIYGEKITTDLSFHTTNIGNKKWLEIKAGTPCQVWLMEGAKEIKSTEGWFTKELANLPQVTMYEVARGIGNISVTTKEKFPWIRLNTDILLHATDYTGKDNHSMLGLPHTYSCILLPINIVEQLTGDFPEGFMVIIH